MAYITGMTCIFAYFLVSYNSSHSGILILLMVQATPVMQVTPC